MPSEVPASPNLVPVFGWCPTTPCRPMSTRGHAKRGRFEGGCHLELLAGETCQRQGRSLLYETAFGMAGTALTPQSRDGPHTTDYREGIIRTAAVFSESARRSLRSRSTAQAAHSASSESKSTLPRRHRRPLRSPRCRGTTSRRVMKWPRPRTGLSRRQKLHEL